MPANHAGFFGSKTVKDTITEKGVVQVTHSDMSVNSLTIADMEDQEPKQKEDNRNLRLVRIILYSWLARLFFFFFLLGRC